MPILQSLKSTRMAVWVWMLLRSEIWIWDECQVNILLLSTTNSFLNRGTQKDMKALSFLLRFSSAEASNASSRLPSLIFSLLFLPSCPHSIHFHPLPPPPPPSVSFTEPFISTQSLNLPPAFSAAPRCALSHFLHLSVISLPFLSTFRSYTDSFRENLSFIGIFSVSRSHCSPWPTCFSSQCTNPLFSTFSHSW